MNAADMQQHKLNKASRNYRWLYNDKKPMDTAVAIANKKCANLAHMRKKCTEQVMVIKAQEAADTYVTVNCPLPTKWENPRIYKDCIAEAPGLRENS